MGILKERFKLGFNLFLYLSLFFLAYYLYKQNYLTIPEEFDWAWMVFSFGFLFLGFSINAIQWVPLLRSQGMEISYTNSIRTFGMAVFGKYIPGKVWVHIGKSAQIAHAYGFPVAKVSEVSFFSQILSLWVSALAGIFLIVYLGKFDFTFWGFLGFFILCGLLIFTKSVQKLGSAIIHKLLKRNFSFTSLHPKDFSKVLPLYFLSILSYSVGFLFFAKALGAEDINGFAMFVFPLAMSIGVVAIIVPGGLGVREVVISSLMVALLVPLDLANMIAVASRLWFLTGEVYIFLFGLVLQGRWKSKGK